MLGYFYTTPYQKLNECMYNTLQLASNSVPSLETSAAMRKLHHAVENERLLLRLHVCVTFIAYRTSALSYVM